MTTLLTTPEPDKSHHTLLGFLSRPLASKERERTRYRPRPDRAGSLRYGRRRVSASVRLVAGLVAIGALMALLEPVLWP